MKFFVKCPTNMPFSTPLFIISFVSDFPNISSPTGSKTHQERTERAENYPGE